MNQPATTLPAPRVHPVPHGTAEHLARLAHFRALDLPEVEELDSVAGFLLGDVGDALDRANLWNDLREDCQRLFHLISDDWDESDLDEAPDNDPRWWPFTCEQETQARYEMTRDRLCADIESTVWRHRYIASEARRTTRGLTAVQDLASAR